MATGDGNKKEIQPTFIDVAKAKVRPISIGSFIVIFGLFSMFYGFDTIYARAASVQKMELSINNRLDKRDIEDLEDKIFLIDMKEVKSRTDIAMRQRYQARLDALRN